MRGPHLDHLDNRPAHRLDTDGFDADRAYAALLDLLDLLDPELGTTDRTVPAAT